MLHNLKRIPFSRYGSYIAISEGEDQALYLRLVYRGFLQSKRRLYKLMPSQGEKPLEWELDVQPWLLTMKTEVGRIRICMKDKGDMLIQSDGPELQISYLGAGSEGGFAIKHDDHCWRFIDPASRAFMQWCALSGELRGDAPYVIGDRASGSAEKTHTCTHAELRAYGSEGFRLHFRTDQSDFLPYRAEWDMDEEIEEARRSYEAFRQPMLPGKSGLSAFENAIEQAIYVLWASFVAPEGMLKRPGLLMSKNWMTNIWSWDHCFNAIALSKTHPELAWDQMQVIFDHQLANGQLPDYVNHEEALRIFTKAPVHGWAMRLMRKKGFELQDERLSLWYRQLSDWTRWWLTYRDQDGDGICQYNHGFDGCWDNATVFDEGLPVESPDLTAYLLIQMQELSQLALLLGLEEESEHWLQLYHDTMERFVRHSWDGESFYAVHAVTGTRIASDSLLGVMPIVLGELLPEEMFKKLAGKLSDGGEFLSPYGLATESLRSEKHGAGDSYWRGPIWAPTTYLCIDGLRRGGDEELAKLIAGRFCRMVAGSGAFYENYEASTGSGLSDPSYTWTASVFLTLLDEYGPEL